jgi:DNA modification methylase
MGGSFLKGSHMPVSQIQQIPLGKLRANPKNQRVHSKRQIDAIARSIKELGFIAPIIVDENCFILAGHGRWLAAKTLSLGAVPVAVVSGLSDLQRRAYLLADNKLTERGGWNRAALAVELSELAPLLADAGLDIDLTGFEAAEIDSLLGDLTDPDLDPADELPCVEQRATSTLGDLWELGPHRLLCGNSLLATDIRKLMGAELATMVIADAPYNLKIKSIVGRGKIKHREFTEASGEMSTEQFTNFLRKSMTLAAQYSIDGSIAFWFIDWRHLREMLAASERVYGEPNNLIVWNKDNGGQGSLYRSKHELVFVYKNGDAPHVNNVELGRHGRNRTNVWDYRGANTFRVGRLDDLSIHPTVKPVAMIADALRDVSRRGDVVLDPFLGSGTTILAAERVGRRGYGVEIDPRYVDAAVRRWQAFTKRDAILKATGQTFDKVAEDRAFNQRRSVK